MKKNNLAFTFVELIVVTMILGILSTIGFVAYTSYLSSSRDGARKTNFANISSALKMYKTNKGNFVLPNNPFSIKNGSDIIAWQGKLTKNVGLSTIDEIPYDPKLKIPYVYSITIRKNEYQIAGTLEDSGNALTTGNYKSVSKEILPTIIVATGSEIDISSVNNLFVYDNQNHNLVYNFEGNLGPTSDGTSSGELLQEAIDNGTFYQNTSFNSCDEIKENKKNIGDGTYEIRTSTGGLTSTGCTF